MPKKTRNQCFSKALPTESEIIAALQYDISSAFELLYRAYRPLLYSLAMREMKDRDNAEECVQDTFLRAYRNLMNSTPTTPSRFATFHPQAWLCKILKNVIRDAKAALGQHKVVSFSSQTYQELLAIWREEEDTEATWIHQETTKQFGILLQNLSPIQQQVISLRYVYRLTFPEIGLWLKINPSTARSHERRAILCLQKLVKDQEDAQENLSNPVLAYGQYIRRVATCEINQWLFGEEMGIDFGFGDWGED